MQTRDYLKYIVEKIHSTVFATVDREGRPVTCAIDIMDYDESGLSFLRGRIGTRQGERNRPGQAARSVPQKLLHGKDLS